MSVDGRPDPDLGEPFAEFFATEAVPYVTGLIQQMPRDGWHVLDTTDSTPEATIDEVHALLTAGA